jgi:hypothetical protein
VENRKNRTYRREEYQRLNPLRTKDRERGSDITDLKEREGRSYLSSNRGLIILRTLRTSVVIYVSVYLGIPLKTLRKAFRK